MAQDVTAVSWNPLVGNASTSSVSITFNAPVAQWRLANRSAVTLFYDLTTQQTPSTGTFGNWLESSGVLTGQGAILKNLTLLATTTGAGGSQAIFNGFVI